MLLSVIFVVKLLTATGLGIYVKTSDKKDVIKLTQYGYVYEPKTDCLAHFTFQVKACWDVHVGLFSDDGDVPFENEILLGGWKNTKIRILDKSISTFILKNEQNVLDCNSYRKFWISWRNNVIAVGRGDVFNNYVLLSFADQSPKQVRYIGISTADGASGEWIIPYKQPPLHCYQHVGWKLSQGMHDTNMTVNITWSVTADNLGQCAMTCNRCSSCMSFVHNKDQKACQGHGQVFSNITEGQGHTHGGSHYYIKS